MCLSCRTFLSCNESWRRELSFLCFLVSDNGSPLTPCLEDDVSAGEWFPRCDRCFFSGDFSDRLVFDGEYFFLGGDASLSESCLPFRGGERWSEGGVLLRACPSFC